jgi:tryptophan synthase alpha chain
VDLSGLAQIRVDSRAISGRGRTGRTLFSLARGWVRCHFLISMDRIAQAFARARANNRAVFVAYLCAGDPDQETSLAACRALIESGVDLLELGVPFSDPLADGLTNQLAAQRALDGGMTAAGVFALVHRLRTEFPELPIVFYTYYNLVFSNGVGAYVRAAREAGVDGMLTLDLPPEEGAELSAACAQEGIKTVLIVAPTTPGGDRVHLLRVA